MNIMSTTRFKVIDYGTERHAVPQPPLGHLDVISVMEKAVEALQLEKSCLYSQFPADGAIAKWINAHYHRVEVFMTKQMSAVLHRRGCIVHHSVCFRKRVA